MEENELNITWLYPDVLNLHGDRGNVMALEKIGNKLGLKVKVDRIDDYDQEIDFDKTDIILINPGEIKVMPRIIDALKKQKDRLKEYIENNKIIFIVGTSGAIMAKNIKFQNNEKKDGLGYFDMSADERDTVYGNDILFRIDDEMEIAGCQIHLMDFNLNSDCRFGEIIYGMGNNGKGDEGARYKNVMFTNALGPVLIKNPWLTEYLIKIAMQNKNINIGDKKIEYDLEEKSLRAIKKFIESKGE